MTDRPVADTGTHREDRIPVDLTQPVVLDVHIPHGDVTVRATDRTDIHIGLDDDEAELMIDARDNRIEVRPHPRAGAGWAGASGDIDLNAVVGQITKAFRQGGPWSAGKAGMASFASGGHAWGDIVIDVPRAMTGHVAIQTASGDVRIEGVTGTIALHTMSGDVRIAGTDGDLTIQTASGDLSIEGARARLTARAASGDVRITAAECHDVQIQTASGDIHLDAMLVGEGPFRAQTASGDVRLTLRQPTPAGEEPAATLAFHTVSGDAHVTPPFRKAERRRWRAGAGDGGGPRIDITTVSGDLSAGFAAATRAFDAATGPMPPPESDIPSTPAAPPVPASPPTEPAPPAPRLPRGESDPTAADVPSTDPQAAAQGDAARLAVLEAVERGEIDVEEALRQLEATDIAARP